MKKAGHDGVSGMLEVRPTYRPERRTHHIKLTPSLEAFRCSRRPLNLLVMPLLFHDLISCIARATPSFVAKSKLCIVFRNRLSLRLLNLHVVISLNLMWLRLSFQYVLIDKTTNIVSYNM